MVIKEHARLKTDINKLATFLLDISPSGVPCREGEGAVDVAIKYIKEAAYWVRKLEQKLYEETESFEVVYDWWVKSEREKSELQNQRDDLWVENIELKEQNAEMVAGLRKALAYQRADCPNTGMAVIQDIIYRVDKK